MSLSDSLSAIQSTMSATTTSNSSLASAVALATAAAQEDGQASRTWLGLLWAMLLFTVRVIPGVLYWLVTFTTISIPTFLFTLFSTSLTFTMNATTL